MGYRKIWLISACTYFVSGMKLCAHYMYALITCMCLLQCTYMHLLRVCKNRVLQLPYRDQRSLNTTGLQCVHFSQQQSSTDLHTVTCNSGKLNAGAKIYASHYRARFTLSGGSTDYLKCCSVPYAYVHIYNSLLHAYNTRIHVHE